MLASCGAVRLATTSVSPFTRTSEPVFVGNSSVIRQLRATIEQVARGDAKVLVTGESGVGKDLVARAIHARSARRQQPYVAVNCAALTDTLLESELFGHVRGSFTGAFRDKTGKLQQAEHGTIFLDEVGEMTLRMQALLLRFLESGELHPVGSDRPARIVDVRIVAATNRDLADLISTGHFREDLMYRLKVVHIHVPPLRERRDDVRALAAHAVQRTGREVTLTEAALSALERYRWPGNVRELQNIVEQAIWMTPGGIVDVEHLPAAVRANDVGRVTPTRERRRHITDELFAGLQAGTFTFWGHVHRLFLDRDLTRHDLRELVRRGLSAGNGSYRTLLRLFGLPASDYKRLLNFLAAHDCAVDFRPYRAGEGQPPARPAPLAPLQPDDRDRAAASE